ncbi:MAG: carbohydrate kinase family protein [Candidatus Humimicrobiaceae bacterium]
MKLNSFDVITLGYIFNENIVYPTHTIGPVLGGTVSYSSVCLGRLGTKNGIVSNISADTPEELLQPFYDAGIDTTGLNMRAGISTTKNLLIYDADGNKTIKYIEKAPSILIEDIPEKYFNAKVFYICPVDFEVPLETIKRIRGAGKYKIACDLGGIGGAHSSLESRKTYGNNVLNIIKEYMSSIDIAKASIEDCYHIFGDKFNKLEDIIRELLDYGSEIVIITLGEKGSLIGTESKTYNIHPIDAIVIDRTGAGDTFTSGFLSEYLISNDIKRAGIFATATSSLLIEKTGGVNVKRFPTRDMVLERMKRY